MTDSILHFPARFEALTGNPPFPWQAALFERLLAEDVPSRCDIPTGLGKTSVLQIWMLALAHHATQTQRTRFPRRLVYVVNRRTVVDQATREAESLLAPERLDHPSLTAFWAALRSLAIQDTRSLHHLNAPVAISTLRGQFADNGTWRADPARPAIIIGTVDMIGSRLLFSGYGRGFKTRPLHAAFLGQNALLVHDEAHLEPAFQELLTAIEGEQSRDTGSSRDGFGRLRVMALTATSRGEELPSTHVLSLGTADRQHAVVNTRIFAKKALSLDAIDERKNKLADRVTEIALTDADRDRAVLIFVRKVDDVQKVTKRLPRGSFATLTGTIRGLERESLKTDPVFARFDPKSPLEAAVKQKGTVYLVCTSAGEVGVDMSADDLVCDLTPFDSMAQRFGRVNRFGGVNARIDVVHEETMDVEANAFELARARTLDLLRKLPSVDGRFDASPAALAGLDESERRAAFTPAPTILPVTDVLFDAWALTSVRDALPGRPPVADWLHGVAEWEPPETHIAWRAEVERDCIPSSIDQRELLDLYPLKAHELLRDRSDRVFKEIKAIAERTPTSLVWLVDEGRQLIRVATLIEVADGKSDGIEGMTLILPPSSGGLDSTGALRGDDEMREDQLYDVADLWVDEKGKPRRVRLHVNVDYETEDQRSQRKGMRLVLSIPSAGEADSADESSAATVWRWYVEPTSDDEQGSRTANSVQTLSFHLSSAEHFAREIANALEIGDPERGAVIWAARFHDLGKERRLWQRSIGNFDPQRVLAKSEGRRAIRNLTKYRHEFGSLFDVETEREFLALGEESKELVRHLIAAHHGRARPGFSEPEIFDPSHADVDCHTLAREIPRRFANLQRTYGRWGLAYLESLLRAADVLASLVIEANSQSVEAAE